jgi:uncharacterized protein (TIGR03437 family)
MLFLALLSATAEIAASSGFVLGVDYSERYAPGALQIATDSFGAIYDLTNCGLPTASCVTKLSADGKTIAWKNTLGFVANTMAVDPNGGVYVIPASLPGDTSIFVAKLGANGTGIAWKAPVGFTLPPAPGGQQAYLAADSLGRAYVAGLLTDNVADVVRLNAAGSAIDYTVHVACTPTSLAVDGAGDVFVAGYQVYPSPQPLGTLALARLAPDGSAGFYSTAPQIEDPVVAVDANGNAAVNAAGANGGVLLRFDSTGALTSSTPAATGSGFALDAAGNAYIAGWTTQLYPIRNSLATCGSGGVSLYWLSVYAPDGSLLQSTYIPGTLASVAVPNSPLIAIGLNSTLFVVAIADATFVPTQTGPFGATGTALLRLSPNAPAQVLPLACMGNSVTHNSGPITPGGFVALFGSGLGPQQGVQTIATMQEAFPTQQANVEVTFDGTPAPLLWVQDRQINVLAPWSLTPGKMTQVCVSYNEMKSNCLTWPVAETDPAVIMVDSVYAAALNQDGTVNSATNPAAPGSIVTVFATGLGPISPPQADGTLVGFPLPSNLVPIKVQAFWQDFLGYGYIPYTVTYAGPVPYLVAGASQINFQLATGYWGPVSVYLPASVSQTFQVYETVP